MKQKLIDGISYKLENIEGKGECWVPFSEREQFVECLMNLPLGVLYLYSAADVSYPKYVARVGFDAFAIFFRDLEGVMNYNGYAGKPYYNVTADTVVKFMEDQYVGKNLSGPLSILKKVK